MQMLAAQLIIQYIQSFWVAANSVLSKTQEKEFVAFPLVTHKYVHTFIFYNTAITILFYGLIHRLMRWDKATVKCS